MLLYRSLPDGFTLLKGIPSEELKLRDLVFVWKVSDQGLGVQRVASSQGLSNAGKVAKRWRLDSSTWLCAGICSLHAWRRGAGRRGGVRTPL